jgi:peroxiredoxin
MSIPIRLTVTFFFVGIGYLLPAVLHGVRAEDPKSSKGAHLIGTPAPEWKNSQWINSNPLKLSGLRGKVVLLRFFMESSCPMCSATAPSLNHFFSKYKEQGLLVVGMYTPKPRPAMVPLTTVQAYVRDFGFEFPVALDNDWQTLRAFWLDRVSGAAFTSSSLLIDKRGVIRYIHAGGEFSATSRDPHSRGDFQTVRQWIEKLLAE